MWCTFALDPQGMLVRPPTPWNFHDFPTWLGPPGTNISVKNAVALYYYAKDDYFCDKERKKPFSFFMEQLSCRESFRQRAFIREKCLIQIWDKCWRSTYQTIERVRARVP